jgi:hypothetical protein
MCNVKPELFPFVELLNDLPVVYCNDQIHRRKIKCKQMRHTKQNLCSVIVQ